MNDDTRESLPSSPRASRPRVPMWIPTVIVGVFALIAGLGIGAATRAKPNAAKTVTTTMTVPGGTLTVPRDVVTTTFRTATVTYTPQPQTQFTDGLQLVGTDIPAGNYRTDGQGDGSNSTGCYYAILNSTDTSDIGDNNVFDGPTRVTLRAGKYFESSGGCTWQKA